ncbi:MAG: MSHA pilin protein MshD [Alphaproteobacteria bacterium]|jgi:MSHA pilin protein MshD
MPVNKINHLNKKHNSKGFTLVELVIGIVLFSVAMVTIVSVIMPQSRQGIDPLWQVRAVSLAQSLLTEISAKAFDEASITAGGRKACNNGTTPCTSSGNLGIEAAETRNSFDDIDDYDGLELSGEAIINVSQSTLTNNISDLFLGFEARISVVYDDNTDGINDDDTNGDNILDSGTLIGNQKLIRVIVVTPGGEEIPFSAYRKNV